MMKRVDLHMHSNYSDDADLPVKELIVRANQKDLAAISITDHNCTAAIDEALELTKDSDLEIIPGVEFDTNYGTNTLHILGYYIDWKSNRIDQLLDGMDEAKMEQFYERIEALQNLGLEITAEEVLEKADVERPLGGFIAKVVLSKEGNQDKPQLQTYLNGAKSDQPYFNFYLDYFKAGAKAYVPCWKPSAKDTINLIRELGGVAVLAHPGSTIKVSDEEVIDDLKSAGLEGIESYSTYHSDDELEGFVELAKEKDLLITAGSDFHGELKPKIELGGVAGNTYDIVKRLKELRGDQKWKII
ncbi:PHP domain-containing protein [Halanaerobacter jeridensis]|uniref:Metal-dependent phosphoesterase TrpH n=1 Tax=Halanaerobacter jeridensis TaxID=706427 RepID=A0A938XV81_9FIRM|nr:PHP domain-containing protein [Halanaerobacter jeridensis]MBM7556202.1 putative metal-dependent phosphoesterase TrpH [Halanaerobacter jeridensis]